MSVKILPVILSRPKRPYQQDDNADDDEPEQDIDEYRLTKSKRQGGQYCDHSGMQLLSTI